MSGWGDNAIMFLWFTAVSGLTLKMTAGKLLFRLAINISFNEFRNVGSHLAHNTENKGSNTLCFGGRNPRDGDVLTQAKLFKLFG
jgi:hypothetical protein